MTIYKDLFELLKASDETPRARSQIDISLIKGYQDLLKRLLAQLDQKDREIDTLSKELISSKAEIIELSKELDYHNP